MAYLIIKKYNANEFIDNLIGDKIVSSMIMDDNAVNTNNGTIDNLNSINLRKSINIASKRYKK